MAGVDQGVPTEDVVTLADVFQRWRRLVYVLRDAAPLNQGRGQPTWGDMDHRMQILELEVERFRYLVSDLIELFTEVAPNR